MRPRARVRRSRARSRAVAARTRPAAAALVIVAALAGCGGPPADLLLVERDGAIPGARLTLLVSNDGFARCNRGERQQITSAQLIDARELARDLNGEDDETEAPADRDLRLAPGPTSILRYDVRVEDGSVSFSDTSRGQPQAFYEIAKLTRDIAKQVCDLAR